MLMILLKYCTQVLVYCLYNIVMKDVYVFITISLI